MMKKIYSNRLKKQLAYLCLLGIPLLLLGSCKEDDHFEMPEEMKARVFERLQSDPDYSTFVEGVEKAGLADILQRSGLYTAYAPTNAAFDAYLQEAGYSSIESIPDTTLTDLINYHFMTPMKFSFDFKDQDRFNTRARKYLTVTKQGNTFRVDDANVLPEKMDMEAMNGAIHGIDKVLVPKPSLNQAVAGRADLETFNDLLNLFTLRRFDGQNSGDTDNDGDIDSVFVLESLLKVDWRDQTKLFTVFAPTDAAWSAFFASQPQFSDTNPMPRHLLELLLNYHLVEGAKSMAELGGGVETIGGETLTVTPADVSTPDGPISNGFIHVTNKVFLPASLNSLTGMVYLDRDDDLYMFATALRRSNLSDSLMATNQEFTVFAPTNAAFAKAEINVETETTDRLARIVRYHILTSKKMSADLTDGTLTTHLGKDVTVAGSTLKDESNQTANIIQTDQVASNGVLHKIDTVLTPPN